MTFNKGRIAAVAVVVLLPFLALGHRWPLTAGLFTSDKTCGERNAPWWIVERLEINCDRLGRN